MNGDLKVHCWADYRSTQPCVVWAFGKMNVPHGLDSTTGEPFAPCARCGHVRAHHPVCENRYRTK